MKLFLAIACVVLAVSADPNSPNFIAFTVGSVQFGFDMYKEALKTDTGNILISPTSAEIVMALVNVGAEGETAQQIVSSMHLPADQEKLKEAIQELLPLLKGHDDKYILKTANKMYVKDGFKIKEEFETVATTVFDADVENIDISDAVKAVNDMNKWVEDKTEDKIKDLLKSSDITDDTRLVLINALYLNAKWQHQFKKYRTTKKPFYVDAGHEFEANMMSNTGSYKYYQCDIHNLQVLELPLKNEEIVMTIMLPNEKDGLARMESQLDDLLTMPLNLTDTVVELELPKFKIEFTLEMNDVLQNLGIVKAFDRYAAELTKIAQGDEQLYISKVTQKTYMEVDEEGIEAAAATAVVIPELTSAPVFRHIEKFHADHPFMFVFTHKVSGQNLFIGRVNHPEEN